MFLISTIIVIMVVFVVLNGAYRSYLHPKKLRQPQANISPNEKLRRAYRNAVVTELSIGTDET